MNGPSDDNSGAASRLRLVRAAGEAIARGQLPTAHARARLIGLSTGTEGLAVRAPAWHTLIECLEPDEILELRHAMVPGSGHPGRQLTLDARLLHGTGGQLRSSRHLVQALEAALPQLSWAPVEDDAPPAASPLLPLQAVIHPASLKLRTAGPPTTSESTAPANSAMAEVRLPYPAPLPNWPLTAPVDEPLIPDGWQLVIRVSKLTLVQEARLDWLRARQALLQGTDLVRWPGASDWHLSPGTEACKAAAALIAEALRYPARLHTVRVQVRARVAPSRFALQRIGQDVFGALPFDVMTTRMEEVCPLTPSGPLLTRHGVGGWFMHPATLATAGVPVKAKDPATLPQGPGSQIGVTASGRPVLLPDATRTSHTLVVGASGSGKSTLLRQLMLEDIRRGSGLALLDPHGELVDDLLASMPASRADDVVVVDIADPHWRYSINPLQGTQNDEVLRNFVAGQVCNVIDKLFEDHQSSGPVTRQNVRLALMLAMTNPAGPTLQDAVRLIEDGRFRDMLLDHCPQELARSIRTLVRTSGEHGFDNWKPYITARLEPFCASPWMRRFLNEPTTLDVPSLIRERRVVLFRLPKSLLSDAESQVLGSMILLQFHLVAMRGAADASPRRRPFQLFVDEFHAYCTPTVPALFREARKFGIGLTVATQSVASIQHPQSPTLIDDVLGNTACKVLFRLSPRDAARIDEYTEPEFSAAAIARQANFRAVLSLPAADVQPFQIRTRRPEQPAECADASWLRERSGLRFGAPLTAPDTERPVCAERNTRSNGLGPFLQRMRDPQSRAGPDDEEEAIGVD